jgi:hypothetical protein
VIDIENPQHAAAALQDTGDTFLCLYVLIALIPRNRLDSRYAYYALTKS